MTDELYSTDAEKPKPFNPLVVHFGGGTNSTALLVGLQERGYTPQAILFADTGGEKPATYEFMQGPLSAWLLKVRFPPYTVVRYNSRKDATLEEEAIRLQVLPSIVYGRRTCSQKWKIDPQLRYLRKHYKGPPVAIGAVGFDYGEFHRIKPSKQPDLEFLWYPLVGWKWARPECIAAIKRAGLPQPGKSACFFCPSSRKPEVVQLSKDNPRMFARAVKMEQIALASGKLRKIDGLGRHWSWERLVQIAAQSPTLFDRLADPPEIACACFDGEPE